MAVERRVHLRSDDVYVADVSCGGPPRSWTEPRPAPVFGLVLVRRGVVRSRVDGVEQLMDPATVFVERLGVEQQFAHPLGGDAYTEIVLSEPAVASLLDDDPGIPSGLVHVSPTIGLRHRLLLARARAEDGDGFEVAENSVRLAATIFAQLAPDRVAAGRPATEAARRRLVDDARTALAVRPGLRLDALSREVGCSPHHLSRVFADVTGTTLSHYRNRLRTAQVLDRLSEGERDLRQLALELGFADQAHMTHVVRRATGYPPGRLRALLGVGGVVVAREA
ncbi:helix-turn-helix domain-containing protein [Streptomyces caatingaensis]|uniref:HTH araC/xylS-type domain-containing protein n=1 Tax=Streptomyces caatingaensis TaxID=1678637 RepID=A0A0K9XBX2_9ACTN|nr:AraC family transcriptional regulator [Streptomyces caatingaensis]KNB50688.1 hypothetical protein AC230_19610 [Streptomyces caatingaensis]